MNFAGKLGLGTVQWGMPYGIANRTGQPDDQQVSTMLARAKAAGVLVLDTAHDYGTAEFTIGGLAASGGLRCVTKTPYLRVQAVTPGELATFSSSFSESLCRLGTRHVHGLLVHDAGNLLSPGGERLWDWLQTEKAKGRVRKVGASVYRPDQLSELLDRYPLDIVQLPLNVYDQRFLSSGLLARLDTLGVEVHARSAFLQGLLLLDVCELPVMFHAVRAHHDRWRQSVGGERRCVLAAALRFCLERPEVDYVIVGADNDLQLAEILAAAKDERTATVEYASFALSDDRVLDPSKWALS